MANRVPQDYIRSARRRLDSAADLYREASARHYDDAFLELADVAMLVWSAGIDVLSALMLFDGRPDLGTSSQRHHYLRFQLYRRHPQRDLRMGWGHLAQLHSFQHNLDLPQGSFVGACRHSSRLFRELNDLLPSVFRLPDDAYAWLLGVE